MDNFDVFNVIFGEQFYKCIVNIKRFYAAYKNKVIIIIWPGTVKLQYVLVKNFHYGNVKSQQKFSRAYKMLFELL